MAFGEGTITGAPGVSVFAGVQQVNRSDNSEMREKRRLISLRLDFLYRRDGMDGEIAIL